MMPATSHPTTGFPCGALVCFIASAAIGLCLWSPEPARAEQPDQAQLAALRVLVHTAADAGLLDQAR